MQAIERLKEKIEAIRNSYQAAQAEIAELREALAGASSSAELEMLKQQLAERDAQIAALQSELAEKDTEIEAIIAKVETLLG